MTQLKHYGQPTDLLTIASDAGVTVRKIRAIHKTFFPNVKPSCDVPPILAEVLYDYAAREGSSS